MSLATPQPQPTVTTGIVKWFDSKGGFGFITVLAGEPMANKDIFVHYSSLSIEHSQYKYLVLGEYVEFVLAPSDNPKYEYTAQKVTGIRGGNLMCESRRLSALQESPTSAQITVDEEVKHGFTPVVNKKHRMHQQHQRKSMKKSV
jgi:cold shock CspA family protein